jgi:predicted DCC family thiol-disulfide oxidoreductase YuxK
MKMSLQQTEVYYDGSCRLCSAEIAYYKRQHGAADIVFKDVSQVQKNVCADLSRRQAMARFHVRKQDGTLVCGALAFRTLWLELPKWRKLGIFLKVPGMLFLAELIYRAFLPVRPILARLINHTPK